MKNLKITLAVVCLFSMNVFSQSSYSQGNSMLNQNREPTKEEIEKIREENLDKVMVKLTDELKLDALQVIAIRQIYTDNIKKQGIILKKEDSDENKTKLLNSLAESTETRVIVLLDPQQKEKYELLKSGKDMKKEKKKKKSKEKE